MSPLHRSFAGLGLAVAAGLIVLGCSTAGASPVVSIPSIPSLPAAVGSALASAGAGSGNGPLACDVVTSSMLNTALGVTVASPTQAIESTGGSTCDFKDAGVTVRVFPNKDASFLASMKNSFSGAVDLPGVGDGAWYSQANATVMVLKGTTVVEVQAPNQNDQAKLAALATAIAANLH